MTVCASEQVIQRRQVLRRKVVVIGRLANCYRLLKEHPELVKQLKSLSNGKIPAGTLSKGEKGLRDAILSYSEKLDPKDSLFHNCNLTTTTTTTTQSRV